MANIVISGLTSAGKTTHARVLARRFNLRYVSASELLLVEAGYEPRELLQDFWITDESQTLRRLGSIEDRLLALERDDVPTIFDSFFFAWIHERPSLKLWLESDVRSRTYKAIVSHIQLPTFNSDELADRIAAKDADAARRLHELTGADLFADRSPFQEVVDLSALIDQPTLEASKTSIKRADELISPIVSRFLN